MQSDREEDRERLTVPAIANQTKKKSWKKKLRAELASGRCRRSGAGRGRPRGTVGRGSHPALPPVQCVTLRDRLCPSLLCFPHLKMRIIRDLPPRLVMTMK